MSERLLIVGASSRAAAFSAIRAGFRPVAADMFADVDLRACCPTVRVPDYPRGIVGAARTLPSGPWLYTGALENHPQILAELSDLRELVGNAAGVVREVRDPWKVLAALRSDGLRCPDAMPDGHPLPPGTWLRKPFRSAGGRGIAPASRPGGELASAASQPRSAGRRPSASSACGSHFLQQRIDGESVSGVYIAARGKSVLLGVTRQLVGCDWAAARPWWYVGSLGPAGISGRLESELDRIGQTLARRFPLVGLFGVDAVINSEGAWAVEVNPRYTASIEVLERSTGMAAVGWHVSACREGTLPTDVPVLASCYHGKAFVYASRRVGVTRAFRDFVERANAQALPQIADVPELGSFVDRGWPIATVFASGATHEEVRQRLQSLARETSEVLQTQE